ncbi:hypothetical protein RJ641_025147 [Dillenia turbinata]|uniref:Uncharacterized protein n=1 Tax=Dillenia turbinata TaxID=194707 RepID=A0AAN8W136_9MAGN
MPPVDLETLVCGCSDAKVVCETIANNQTPLDHSEKPQDSPPDSFWLSKDAELDWFDRNLFYERKESTKGISNPTHPNSTSNSQRYSLKSKASIIGLPKPQKSCYADCNTLRRNNRHSARLFPNRPDKKPVVQVVEPGSPKVSCMGRVRSKKDRNRRSRSRRRSVEPALEKAKSCRRKKSGFWNNFRSIFKTGCKHQPSAAVDDGSFSESVPRSSVTVSHSDFMSRLPASEAPGLGGVKKFSSGRRSWELGEAGRASDADVGSVGGDSVSRR